MHAEKSAQLRLLDLAAVDTEIAQLLHRRATLEEHARIVTLSQERKKVTARLVGASTALSDAEYALEKAERDIEPVRQRLEREKTRLDSGTVSDPRTVANLISEVDKLSERLSDLEDAQLEAMELVEQAQSVKDRIQAERDSGDVVLREVMAARDTRAAEIDREVTSRRQIRETIFKELPTDLTGLYEKIKERSGLGAAKLHQGRCGGCGLNLNPADLRRIEATMSNEVIRCEECGRILVRTPESGI